MARLTQTELLPRVWGQREAQYSHRGDQEARHDQVVEIVQGPPSQLDNEGYVKIGLRAAVIRNRIFLPRDP